MSQLASLVFFGNEKLATGIPAPELSLRQRLRQAGYQLEAEIDGQTPVGGQYQSPAAVLAAHGRILPQSVLDLFPLGIINIHPSLLPIYRGSTPIEAAILNGDNQTGVTIMKVTAKMDSGPIYTQQAVDLSGHETKIELAEKLHGLGGDLLFEVLPQILDGSLQPKSQEGEPTFTKLLNKADGVIDWHRPAAQLEREIRAYLGWPSSQTQIAGAEVIITEASVIEVSGSIGQTIVQDKKLIVYCGEDGLQIEKLKPAGKREMTAQEFLAGHQL